MNVILETKDLCKHYGAGESLVKAIDHADISIFQHEFVAIVGKFGCDPPPQNWVCVSGF